MRLRRGHDRQLYLRSIREVLQRKVTEIGISAARSAFGNNFRDRSFYIANYQNYLQSRLSVAGRDYNVLRSNGLGFRQFGTPVDKVEASTSIKGTDFQFFGLRRVNAGRHFARKGRT